MAIGTQVRAQSKQGSSAKKASSNTHVQVFQMHFIFAIVVKQMPGKSWCKRAMAKARAMARAIAKAFVLLTLMF